MSVTVRRLALVVLSCLLGAASPAGAQVTGRGTEFWACWPRSHLSLETSAEVIVMSDAPTTAQIDGAFSAGPSPVAPGAPWIVPLPQSLRMAASRTILPTGFRVRSLDPTRPLVVTLRVPVQAEASDDTARLLPVAELGTRYIVTSYPASLPGEPSLYAVVATEDATQVVASVPCLGISDTVVLDRGEAWQVSCDWRSVPNDVTGAVVTSDRPVAVFGGNSDAYVPTNYLSGDFVVEQLAPVASWGTEFYVTPLPKGPAAVPGAHDVLRITPSAAGTAMVDDGAGAVAVTLQGAGVPSDVVVTAPLRVTTDVPCELFQFASGIEMTDLGDPFMAEVPAVSHWGTGARAWIPAYYSLGNHLMLTTDLASTASARIDGAPVSGWSTLPGGTHASVTVAVGTLPGERVVSCDAPIGVLAFGYNDAYLPDPGLGRTPGSHGTPAAHAVPPCAIAPQVSAPSTSCLGATVRLSDGGTTATNCGSFEYRFLENGVEISGCGFSSATQCDAQFRGDTTYALEVRCATDPACGAVATQRVVDQPAPPVSIVPNPATACAGSPLDLLANDGFVIYAWASDVPDPGVTPRASSLPGITVTPDVDTRYTVTAFDVRGCASTSSVQVTVTPDPLPRAVGDTLRVTRSGALDTDVTWQDVPDPARDYEVVVLDCASRDWRNGCAGRSPDPTTMQNAPLAGPPVAVGTQALVHAGAVSRGDLLFYLVRATSPCAGLDGPTCNPWPMQLPPCP